MLALTRMELILSLTASLLRSRHPVGSVSEDQSIQSPAKPAVVHILVSIVRGAGFWLAETSSASKVWRTFGGGAFSGGGRGEMACITPTGVAHSADVRRVEVMVRRVKAFIFTTWDVKKWG